MLDIDSLVRRADAYAAASGRTSGGVSKLIFQDTRTLDLLRDGSEAITVARLRKAEAELRRLEIEVVIRGSAA